MSVGRPKIQARVNPANLEKLEHWAKLKKYGQLSDAVRAIVLERLKADGYTVERED